MSPVRERPTTPVSELPSSTAPRLPRRISPESSVRSAMRVTTASVSPVPNWLEASPVGNSTCTEP